MVSATNLGRSGLYDWIVQRATAVVIAGYFLAILGFLVCGGEVTYAEWHSFMSCTTMKVATLVTLLATAAHAWVGLWTISTDYLTSQALGKAGLFVRLSFQGVCALLLWGSVIWGVMIVWGV